MPEHRAYIMLAFAFVSACGDSQDIGPGGVSAEDAAALDEAAEKLEKDSVGTAEKAKPANPGQ